MTTTNEPFATFLGGGQSAPLLPGTIEFALRQSAYEDRQAERERLEREALAAERSEQRFADRVLQAQRDAAFRGLPWSPENPFQYAPSVTEWVAQAFALDDARAARAELHERIRAGEVAVIDTRGGAPVRVVAGIGA